MPDLYLLEPAVGPAWAPFQDARPVSELRAGAWLIRERWEAVADGETRAIFGPDHLQAFVEDGVPPVRTGAPVTGPALVGRADFAPSGVPPELGKDAARLVNEEATVGWWVPAGQTWSGADDSPDEAVPIEGMQLHGAFDLVTALEHLLVPDVQDFLQEHGEPFPDGCVLVGDPGEVMILGSLVEPGVVFDTRRGPIVLEQYVYVRSGTRLEGPLYVGPGTELLGGSIGWSSVGPRCRVRGDVSSCVFMGYANKAHDGFVGHSAFGRWVNLGAGTITSNLKNTYGNVRLEVGADRVETGRQFMGTLMGDHAKTAIGTLLPTGAVIGAGANVFGRPNPPKQVPSFAWGLDGGRMSEDGFLTVARRVLPRRQVEVTDAVAAMLTAVYRHATG
jgi:UDP-N-acetylglucosamine diphosphorylase/glucosamine-1-phosphate N-acetyltransferase